MIIRKAILYIYLTWLSTAGVSGQIALSFVPTLSNYSILSDNNIPESLTIDVFKMYIGNLAFYDTESKNWIKYHDYYLLDSSNPESFSININTEISADFDSIQFGIGVDSLTHEQGAFSGALDPIHGMYWTWQSGYINFKLEGKCRSCNTRNHDFQFHLGGYAHGYNTYRQVTLAIEDIDQLTIELPLDFIIDQLDSGDKCTIMSPGDRAVELSEILATQCKIKEL